MAAGNLVLTRRPGETVRIGRDIAVTVERVDGCQVRLSFIAPKSLPIHRQEVFEAIEQDRRELQVK